MYWIIQFIIRHRNTSSLFLTVLLSLLMLTANTERQQIIARSLTITIFYPFQFTVHQATRIKNIFAETLPEIEFRSISAWANNEKNRLRVVRRHTIRKYKPKHIIT